MKYRRVFPSTVLLLFSACAAPAPKRAPGEAVSVRPVSMTTLSGRVFRRVKFGGYLEFQSKSGDLYVLEGKTAKRIRPFLFGGDEGLPVTVTGFPLENVSHRAGPVFEVVDYQWQ
ncbi:MAG TPA: hypothetical protein P5079_05275 [Elusimicrobiota bacterium]|nr:hypothetical protein [Elusimicrobiota bacterium]